MRRSGSASDPGRSAEVEAQRLRQYYLHFDGSPAHQRRRDPRNRGNILMGREREAMLRALLPRALPGPLSERRVLDVGCGRGDLLGWLTSQGVPPGNMTGLDISHGF